MMQFLRFVQAPFECKRVFLEKKFDGNDLLDLLVTGQFLTSHLDKPLFEPIIKSVQSLALTQGMLLDLFPGEDQRSTHKFVALDLWEDREVYCFLAKYKFQFSIEDLRHHKITTAEQLLRILKFDEFSMLRKKLAITEDDVAKMVNELNKLAGELGKHSSQIFARNVTKIRQAIPRNYQWVLHIHPRRYFCLFSRTIRVVIPYLLCTSKLQTRNRCR